MKTSHFFICILCLAALAISGCADDGVKRKEVWGKIDWNGQPIPRGVIYLTPNTRLGNKGPAGFAMIKDGSFDTRFERSKGCMTGPLIALVHAGDGQHITSDHPYGNPLFAPYELELEVPADGGEIDLTIPGSVLAITPQENNKAPE